MAVEALTTLAGVTSTIAGEATKVMHMAAPGHVSAPGQAAQNLDVRFSAAMNRMEQIAPTGNSMPTPVKGLFDAMDQVNLQARSVSDYAATAEASGGQLTPGEIVQLTMKCQEFMFQCQLTSNIANRSSDGVQQLFRQQ
ncbi:MAG: hypothetical protein ACRCY3_03915 [Sphingorhabdus sp.]